MKSLNSPWTLALLAVLFCFSSVPQTSAAPPQQSTGETIVLIRHGEKPPAGLGQLDCKGLNRALALPDVLIKRYGKPDFVYAPNPAVRVYDGQKEGFSYVRPLMTIEPTAIRLGLPVNAQIGFTDIDKLQTELLQPAHANSLIFVAWEHLFLYRFARQMLLSHGKDPSAVPDWPDTDYDTIYVFRIQQRPNGMPQVIFTIAKEMLDASLSDKCPSIR